MNNFDHLPDGCPLPQSKPYARPVYRGINPEIGALNSARHFANYHQLGRINPNANAEKQCMGHALSVWLSVDAFQQARGRQPALRDWALAEIGVENGEAMVAQTGKKPDHFSFWSCDGFDAFSRSKIVEPALP